MAQDRDHQPGKTPISAHPAFPAIVGLWFAALLGLGTIVMPAIVLEQIATATGLASIFPPAEPPLSAAGRALFALLATIVGLIGGLVLARRVVQAHDAVPPSRRRTPAGRSTPPRPLSVHDDLGEDAIAPPVSAPRAGRRRALAVTDETSTSDFLMAAPLPGETEVPELPQDPELHEEPMSERPSEFEAPLDTGELDLSELTSTPQDVPFDMPAYVPELDTRKPRPIVAPSKPETAAMPVPVAAAPIVTAPIDGPLDGLGMVQLAERLGRSLQERHAAHAIALEPQTQALPHGEPLDLQNDAIAVPPPVVPDALRAFMDVPPEDFAPPSPVAAIDTDDEVRIPPPVVPSALMPFAFAPLDDEDDDDDDAAPFTLPLSKMMRPLDVPVDLEDAAEDEDDALADENYSSLLEMTNPFRPREEFVRIDEPEAEDDAVEPAVVFPAQERPAPQAAAEADDKPEEAAAPAPVPTSERPFDAPRMPAPNTAPMRQRPVADAAETERALRAALANLQRMSGAA